MLRTPHEDEPEPNMTVPASHAGSHGGSMLGPALRVAVVARETVLVLGFALALAFGARIALPLGFTPVPVTAQTFIVLVGGVLLGARRAGGGGLAYLALGVAGVPWFAAGGATLGYIAGFAVAALLVGRAAEAGRLGGRGQALVVMVVAHLAIYVTGATWLALFLGVGPSVALSLGVVPFLVGDAIKVVAAATIAPSLVRVSR
jgi:biotin transport system substrate-specific component